MAGRYHHAAGEPSTFRFVGNIGRGEGTIEKLCLKPIAGQYLRHPPGKLLRHKAAVVSHQNRTGSGFLRFHVVGNRLGHYFHVRKCKVTTDDASPPVGAELDLGQNRPRWTRKI